MATTQPTDPSATETKNPLAASPVPLLGEGFNESVGTSASADGWPAEEAGTEQSATEDEGKSGRLPFWHAEKTRGERQVTPSTPTSHPKSAPTSHPSSPMAVPQPGSPKVEPASPGRVQSSPRVASPASSQIFERNVQEDVAVNTASSAIPSHITTENHIPPVLDASSMAITDDQLTPDTVEIVTHAAHQPASVAVTGTAGPEVPPSFTAAATSTTSEDAVMSQSQTKYGSSPIVVPVPLNQSVFGTTGISSSMGGGGDAATSTADDGATGYSASNYGSLDATDVRRLSFISFADVVHAEQAAGADQASMRDSLVVSPITNSSGIMSPATGIARSASPMRSPISPSLSATSITGSGSPRFTGIEGSPPAPSRLGTGSPQVGLGVSPYISSGSPPMTGGELTIETMRQALRKTGSGDLSGIRAYFGTNEESDPDRTR